MAWTFYYHPLSSFCWKALIALYEKDAAFQPEVVDLSDGESRAAFERIWPLAKFPVLRDDESGMVLPESSIIVEYVDSQCAGPVLIPADADAALQVRLWDRLFDNYVHLPMQRIVGDRLRAAEARDPQGMIEARAQLDRSYALADRAVAGGGLWATGAAFSMADCAAAPALYYADRVHPIGPAYKALSDYLERLKARPSFARVLMEAGPYMHMFPA